MKITIDIDALTTRHSFSGEEVSHFLEVRILGNQLRVPVTDAVIEAIDLYISETSIIQPHPQEVRREYPPSYEEGVEYELGTVSFSDMEDT